MAKPAAFSVSPFAFIRRLQLYGACLSAFAVIFERQNTPVDPAMFARIMEQLIHRGPNGSDTLHMGNLSMGHWHFWTTPEEINERQPLELSGSPFKIVFDGRIDNREELFGKLSLESAGGKSLSDAALALRAYAHWGDTCFEQFVGEFALVIFDEHSREVICARDQLGDRGLYYALDHKRLVIASEPWAVARAYDKQPELNESAVVHFFALQVLENGQTFFNDVYELLPAHIIKVDANGQRTWRYWQPDSRNKIRYKTDQEYADHFLALLTESVCCRMRSVLPVGVMMSGGLDSTSVASLAARIITPKSLTTISYVFDELTDCDERRYIDAVKERWNTCSIQFTGDDDWAFKNWKDWPHNPNQPSVNFYRLLLEHTFKRAKEEGIGVLLTGHAGDHLYDGRKDWIADMLIDGKFKQMLTELASQIKGMGWKATLKTGHLRRTARRILDGIHPGIHLPRSTRTAPAWLDPNYAKFLTRSQNSHPAFERYGLLLRLMTSQDIVFGVAVTSSYGIEYRHPYRDRRLVEFILAIPAYQIYRQGIQKYILRAAMRGILPEDVRTRSGATSFLPLYFRGVEMEKTLIASALKDEQAEWQKFLRPSWASRMFGALPVEGPEILLPFLCISFSAWKQLVFSKTTLSTVL